MLKIILFLFALLFTALAINAQSISYSVGYGLPISSEYNSDFYINEFETYKRDPELTFAIGLSNHEKITGYTQLRFTTFQASIYNSIGDSFSSVESSLSIRKYIVELQNYFYKLDLKQIGSIEFGSKVSMLIRSDVSGYFDNITNSTTSITSFDYERQSKIYASLLARYAIKPIKLSPRFSIQPSYTFSYSFHRNVNSNYINTQLRSHIFELSLISPLSTRKKN